MSSVRNTTESRTGAIITQHFYGEGGGLYFYKVLSCPLSQVIPELNFLDKKIDTERGKQCCPRSQR